MTEEKNNVIKINNVEYNKDDLSKEQNYFIQQIAKSQADYNTYVAAADRANASKDMFTNRLIQSIDVANKKDEKEKK